MARTDWEEVARRNDVVVFSNETVVAETGRVMPAFFTDGWGKRFRFKDDGRMFVTYQSVDNENAFKLLTPDMAARNVTRRMFEAAENCKPKKAA